MFTATSVAMVAPVGTAQRTDVIAARTEAVILQKPTSHMGGGSVRGNK